MKKSCLFILCLLLFSGCSSGLYDEININNIEPGSSELKVRKFEKEHTISLEWEADQGAEEYILYRDEDPDGSFSRVVYQGTDLIYEDKKIIDDRFYYYKLAKKRESRIFPRSDLVLGVGSDIRKDQFEDNGSQSSAARFQNKTSANIYYYRDSQDNTLEDRDWYAVRINPRTKLTIVIKNCHNFVNGDLYFNESGGILQSVHNGVEFSMSNYSYQAVEKYFQISINTSQFLGSASATGGKFSTYDICFVITENISE